MRRLPVAIALLVHHHINALGVQDAKKVSEASEAIEIPQWRLDLATGRPDDWWTRNFASPISSLIWGTDRPEVTASPAQDHQRCPIVKLPNSFVTSASYASHFSIAGTWSHTNFVKLASWEQNFLSMGFSRDLHKVTTVIRTASTNQVAIRTRPFTNKEMETLFNWKAANASFDMNKTMPVEQASLQVFRDFNIAIFDCVGTLMYVVRENTQSPREVQVFSRDGSLIAKSHVGDPVLKYQFIDPQSGYLIATAEAPGINASIPLKDIPASVAEGGVVPVAFHFERGGYTNSSPLMDIEYHWVLATAVQALSIYRADAGDASWQLTAVVEGFLILCLLAVIFVFGGSLFCIYRCVFPHGHDYEFNHGRHAAENPFLADKKILDEDKFRWVSRNQDTTAHTMAQDGQLTYYQQYGATL